MSQENALRYTLSGLRRARQTDPWQGPSQRSHWHRAESLSWVRVCGRVADLKIGGRRAVQIPRDFSLVRNRKWIPRWAQNHHAKIKALPSGRPDYVNTGQQSNARECSSYVGIAKDAGVAPPKALRVYSNGTSKRAVGEARL